MKPTGFTLVGGEGAVSGQVADQLAGRFGADKLHRLAGANRYETSSMVAHKYFGDRQRRFAVLAYGMNFPDGLAGGTFAYQLGAPLILADSNRYAEAKAAAYDLGARYAFVLGGPTLISDEAADVIVPKKQ